MAHGVRVFTKRRRQQMALDVFITDTLNKQKYDETRNTSLLRIGVPLEYRAGAR